MRAAGIAGVNDVPFEDWRQATFERIERWTAAINVATYALVALGSRGRLAPVLYSLTLLVIVAITLVLGTAMEETTMLVVMTPVLAPVVAHAGIDPVHFGLVFVFATMIGLITPPVGITMFIACQIAGISVNQFTRAVWRPFLALVLALIVAVLWPEMVLFLPNLVMGR